MKHIASSSLRSRQHGAVLFVSLMLLLILTIIGVTAARMQTGEAVMARNDHNHQLAVQSAEAVLRDVETNLANGIYTPQQLSQDSNGLYTLVDELAAGPATSIADTVVWTAPLNGAMPYTGPALSNAPSSPVAAQVIIESLPPAASAQNPLGNTASYGQSQPLPVYRITAHAVGGDSSASATLQSVLH